MVRGVLAIFIVYSMCSRDMVYIHQLCECGVQLHTYITLFASVSRPQTVFFAPAGKMVSLGTRQLKCSELPNNQVRIFDLARSTLAI